MRKKEVEDMTMTKPTQKRTCKGCKAFYANGKCRFDKKFEKIKLCQIALGTVYTGKPLEPCPKPTSDKQYIKELEHYVDTLKLNLLITNNMLEDWKEMYRQK